MVRSKVVLVTGGTGYIGSHVAASLVAAGYSVVLFDNLSLSRREVLNRLQRITGFMPEFVRGDVRDKDLVVEVLSKYQVDIVIHLAGLKSVEESNRSPLDYYDINICGAITLLTAMQETRVKNLIFSSSATVYGDPEYLPIDERHKISPNNPYGRTKANIEQMLRDITNSDKYSDEKSWSIVSLRYFNPVGAHPSGIIGESPFGEPTNLMPLVAKVARGEQDNIKIYGSDYNTADGTAIRDYIHIMDLAEGHVSAIDFIERNKGWTAINLGTGSGLSVMEIIENYRRVSGADINYMFVPRRQGDAERSVACIEKAKKKLNWTAKRGVEDMCLSSWGFINANS